MATEKTNEIVLSDLEEITRESSLYEPLRESVVLISGVAGFLPAYMAEAILFLNRSKNFNVQVIGLVRDKAKAELRFAHHSTNTNLHLVESNLEVIPKLPLKPDYVIHAASAASPKAYGMDPVGTIVANTVGTHGLLQLAQTANAKKFLYFSSSEIYGALPKNTGAILENNYGVVDPLNSRSCYAESKRLGENLCASWTRQYGLPTSIVRPFHTYGPGMKLDDGRVFADFVADIVNHRNILMTGTGLAERSFCYLSDAVKAFFLILLKGTPTEAYNVGNPDAHSSIVGLAELLCSLYPERGLEVTRKAVTNTPYVPSSIETSKPDVEKLKQLGWKPKYSLREGFLRTIRSFENEVIESSKTVSRRAS